jgi:SAM-dependent methyltransferase
LDYGSGPTPVLVELLRKAGWDATGYDPFFAPDADLSRPFNAVVSTETFEHFRQPREETGRVLRLLAPGGVLVVMTSLCDAVTDWPRWHYARDETHVAFYSTRTFAHLAAARGLMPLENNGRNVVVLQS